MVRGAGGRTGGVCPYPMRRYIARQIVQLVVVELLLILLNQVWAQAGRQSTRRMASLDTDWDTDRSKGR